MLSLRVCLLVLLSLVGVSLFVTGRAVTSSEPSLFERVADDLAAAGKDVKTGEESLQKVVHAPPRASLTDVLPRFADVDRFYVTGISSGAFMASQLHVAYSSFISGVGMFAGGPWLCAGGMVEKALNACMDDSEDIGLIDILAAADTAAAGGYIDPVSNLAGSPVWLFHGVADATVKKPVVDAAYQFYLNFQSDAMYSNTTQANHAWISPLGANPCAESDSPYTSNCNGWDAQNEMLTHILRRQLNPPNTGALTGTLSPFSQDYYTLARWDMDASLLSMDTTGYVYVPAACASNTTVCSAVMVLHGCEQSVSLVGQDLIQQAYMNQYADTNNLIIVYPQTIALTLGVVYNPKACWDWWGYLGDDELYANKGGFQAEVLINMLKAMKV